MSINPVNDLGAPAVVAALDIVTSEKKATWNRPLGLGVSVASYLCAAFGIGGDFVKQMGVASFDWGVGSLYAYTKDVTPNRVTQSAKRVAVANRISSARIQRYPAPAYEEGFENVRLI